MSVAYRKKIFKEISYERKWLGGDYNGPTIKSLINNDSRLEELKNVVGDKHADFVTHLKQISNVHYVATRKDLDKDAAQVAIDQFVEHWDQIKDKFNL